MADGKSKAPAASGSSSVSSYFSTAWDLTTKNVNLWVMLCLLAVVPTVIAGLLIALLFDLDSGIFVGSATPSTSGYEFSSIMGAMFVWVVVVGLYNTFVYGAEIGAFLGAARGKSVTIQQAIDAGKENFTRLLVLLILMGIFITLGFIALIIPGIVLAVLFAFAPFISVDKKVGAMDALKQSMNLVTNNFLTIFMFAVLAVLLTIAVSIVGGIILAILPDGLASILSALVNGVMTIFLGLAATKLYLSIAKS